MYIHVLDKSLKKIGLIDNYVSLIWTTRYYEAGDFELYVPVEQQFIDLLQIGYYLQIESSEYTMIVESINLKTDVENGNYMTVSGRSAESILSRRIVANRVNTNNAQVEMFANYLIEWNITDPIVEKDLRKINEVAVASETKGFAETVEGQYFGDNVYDIIVQNCQAYGYGFKMPLINGKFTFEMYAGVDRTRSQKDNLPAVFSSEFENLVNTEYTYDTQELKNVALVAGEGEGAARKTAFSGTVSGLERRETYVDARDLSSEGTTSSKYTSILKNRGKEKLAETEAFPKYVGEVISFPEYCGLGDIVEVKNEFGMTATARIIEIIESDSTSGHTRIPTFDEWSV